MITFFHGLESSSISRKSIYLNKNYDAWCPVMDYTQTELFDKVLNEVTQRKTSLLIGSSMGGWFAYCISTLTGIPTLLFNPALQGRTIEPQVKMGKKEVKHVLILGEKDDIIKPEQTLTWIKHKGIGTFEHHFEDYGHRTPIDKFAYWAENLVKNSKS
jgi:predicted esterase YcpF (UPF0227 family)